MVEHGNGSKPEVMREPTINVGPETFAMAAGAGLIAIACASREKHTKTFLAGAVLLGVGTLAMFRKGRGVESRPSMNKGAVLRVEKGSFQLNEGVESRQNGKRKTGMLTELVCSFNGLQNYDGDGSTINPHNIESSS